MHCVIHQVIIMLKPFKLTINSIIMFVLLKHLGHLTKVIGVLTDTRDFAYLKLRDFERYNLNS